MIAILLPFSPQIGRLSLRVTVVPLSLTMTPSEVAVPDDTTYISRNFIINIQQLKFANPGQYAIDIALDGRQAGSIPLMVRLHEQSKPAPNELDRGF